MGVIFIVLEKFHPYYPLLPPIAHEQLDALTKEIEMTSIRMFSCRFITDHNHHSILLNRFNIGDGKSFIC